MKIRRTLAAAALLTTALLTARPGAPFTLVEKNSFDATLTLSQAAFCDGSVPPSSSRGRTACTDPSMPTAR